VLIGLPDPGLRLSARNQLPGMVSRIMPGAVNTEVVIELDGGGTVAAIITNSSVAELGLAKGVHAVAIFKASSVILGTMA
jgi:molybdate transport system regulatory protein